MGDLPLRGSLVQGEHRVSIDSGLSPHGNVFLQEPPAGGTSDIAAVWLGKYTEGKFSLSSPFLAGKARTSACCISRVGNQLLRDSRWEICAL